MCTQSLGDSLVNYVLKWCGRTSWGGVSCHLPVMPSSANWIVGSASPLESIWSRPLMNNKIVFLFSRDEETAFRLQLKISPVHKSGRQFSVFGGRRGRNKWESPPVAVPPASSDRFVKWDASWGRIKGRLRHNRTGHENLSEISITEFFPVTLQ